MQQEVVAARNQTLMLAVWVLAVAVALLVVMGILASVSGGQPLGTVLLTPDATLGVMFALCGALLVSYQARNRIGWLLMFAAIASGLYVGATGAQVAAATGGWLDTTTGQVVSLVSHSVWWLSYATVAMLLPILYPDGRPLSRRWHWVAVGAAAVAVVGLVALVSSPLQPFEVAGTTYRPDNPIALLSSDRAIAVDGATAIGFVVVTVLGLSSLAVRFRRGDRVVRRQVGWLAYPVVLAVAASFTDVTAIRHASVALIPLGIAVAVARYRLYGIDLLVNRTLLAAALLGSLGLAYAVAVGVVGTFGAEQGWVPPFVGAMTVAVFFHPVYARAQRGVDRVLHRNRQDPYELLADIGSHLRAAAAPRQALSDIARTLRRGLDLPGIRMEIEGSNGVALDGVAGRIEEPRSVPLLWQGQKVGTLVVGIRPDADALEPVDERIIAVIAGPLGAVASALRLTVNLERANEETVRAREEERRRLRRDIHDGLGPQLASVAHRIDAAVRLLAEDPDRSLALLQGASGQVHGALDEARQLVRGLRPPALDELGLVEALRATVPLLAPVDDPVDVRITADEGTDGLPAAVEVATFLIAQEALRNVVRHARAGEAQITIVVGPPLVLDVTDDGIGYQSPRAGGIGIQTMQERAFELGGTFEIAGGPGRGTQVRAVLPWEGMS